MTVQEICKALQESKKSSAAFAVTGSAVVAPIPPDAVLKDDFLADNVLKVHDLLNNRGVKAGEEFQGGANRQNFASEGAFIAQLQANALLSSYQRAAGLVKRTRLERLASKYTRTTINSKDYGPLGGQLRDIGVKADADFTSFIIPEEGQQ